MRPTDKEIVEMMEERERLESTVYALLSIKTGRIIALYSTRQKAEAMGNTLEQGKWMIEVHEVQE